jgi:SAM-dependent methyltransferase
MRTDEYKRMFDAEDGFWWYAGVRGLLQRDAVRCLSGKRKPRVLDAGCGTGRNLQMLRDLACGGGVDLSIEALQLCRNRGITDLARASILELPLLPESVDMVVSLDVLYHLWVTDDIRALNEFHRVLKPGGWLILQVAAFEFLRGSHDEVVYTRHRYTLRELREKVASAGFRVQRTTYRNALLFPLVLGARILKRRSRGAESDVLMPNPVLNAILHGILKFENILLGFMNLPLGSSVYLVAQRPL